MEHSLGAQEMFGAGKNTNAFSQPLRLPFICFALYCVWKEGSHVLLLQGPLLSLLQWKCSGRLSAVPKLGVLCL